MAHNFPRRNRIVTGLSQAVVVVEAAFQSGALVSARLGLEQGKDIFVVPGPVGEKYWEGSNSLLKDGAGVILSTLDIVEYFKGVGSVTQPEGKFKASGGSLEEQVLATLGVVPKTLDAVLDAAALPMAQVAAVLLNLELKGVIVQYPGLMYAIKE